MDSFHQIQLGTVYRGRDKLSDDLVLDQYKKRHIPMHHLEYGPSNSKPQLVNMVQLADIFSKPQMSLLAAMLDYFKLNNIDFEAANLYHDVNQCISTAHSTFHSEIRLNPHLYLHKDPQLEAFLRRLCMGNKKVFLITNSPFETVDVGMKYLVGDEWREYFDVVVVQAGKPHFFTNNAKPFREYDPQRKVFLWDKVYHLRKGTAPQLMHF